MQKTDIRAVENPISAIFDLAATAEEHAPKVRKLVTYSRAFIYLWLFIDFLFIIVISAFPFASLLLLIAVAASLYSLRWAQRRETRVALFVVAAALSCLLALTSIGGSFIAAVLLVLLFYLGWVILDLMRDLRKFFDYYVARHRVIRAVREADPVVPIPDGPDPVSRLLTHLRNGSRELEHVINQPNAVKRPAPLRGKSGVVHDFDALVYAAPSKMWSLTGLAYPGWCVLIKTYGSPPRLDDLKYLKHAAEDVVSVMKVPPSRVIALLTMKEGQNVSEEAYQFLTTQSVTFKHRGDLFLCSLEMVSEGEDRTYDFVPFMTQVPS